MPLFRVDTGPAAVLPSAANILTAPLLQIDTPIGMQEATAMSTRRRLLAVEEDATWGLDIIDQGFLPLDNEFHYINNGKMALQSVVGITYRRHLPGRDSSVLLSI